MNRSLIALKPTKPEDLETLFQIQTDAEAIYLAAFTPKDPFDKASYLEKFNKILRDDSIHMKTILLEDRIIGSIAKFILEGEAEITYWIDKKYWGSGITTQALHDFLQLEHTRPLQARTAFDNIGSQKVLEKNGFKKIGTDKGFANARGAEIEEFIYTLL